MGLRVSLSIARERNDMSARDQVRWTAAVALSSPNVDWRRLDFQKVQKSKISLLTSNLASNVSSSDFHHRSRMYQLREATWCERLRRHGR